VRKIYRRLTTLAQFQATSRAIEASLQRTQPHPSLALLSGYRLGGNQEQLVGWLEQLHCGPFASRKYFSIIHKAVRLNLRIRNLQQVQIHHPMETFRRRAALPQGSLARGIRKSEGRSCRMKTNPSHPQQTPASGSVAAEMECSHPVSSEKVGRSVLSGKAACGPTHST
jgi:hypothetical protein